MEGQVSALIIDDEKPARDELAYLLKGIPEVNVIGQARNGLEAFNLIKQTSPDLIFLDVQMPVLDGFGLIKKLMGKKVRLPHIVFATAYDEYAVQAFEVLLGAGRHPHHREHPALAARVGHQRAQHALGVDAVADPKPGQLTLHIGPPQAGHDRGFGAQAAGGAVALFGDRVGAHRRRLQGLTEENEQPGPVQPR